MAPLQRIRAVDNLITLDLDALASDRLDERRGSLLRVEVLSRSAHEVAPRRGHRREQVRRRQGRLGEPDARGRRAVDDTQSWDLAELLFGTVPGRDDGERGALKGRVSIGLARAPASAASTSRCTSPSSACHSASLIMAGTRYSRNAGSGSRAVSSAISASVR